MKNKINALKERYIRANTEAEHDAIREEMRKLCDEDAGAVADAALESIKETNKKERYGRYKKFISNRRNVQ